MKRIAAQAVVAVPAEVCYRAVQESIVDTRWRDAYRSLRPDREYSGWVTEARPHERIEMTVASVDPMTKKRYHAMGYRTTYDFAPAGDGATRVEVAIEYELLAAVGGMGMLQPQAENEVLHRLAAMLALELGWRAAQGLETPPG